MSKQVSAKHNKIVVILGTTASGKTGLGVSLAAKLDGEIISADSRQVYKGMDVGTGKDLAVYKVNGKKIPYHLIDVVSPQTRFTLSKFQKMAFGAIDDILQRGKLPIIVGGTGQYLQAVVDNYQLSAAKPDEELREKLEKLDREKLFLQLSKINSKFANNLNISDQKNKRRLIRYIEILKSAGGNFTPKKGGVGGKYDFLLVGITYPREVLAQRIKQRLLERLDQEGMVAEVRKLHTKNKVSFKRLKEFGLEYKFIVRHLEGGLEYDEMVDKLNIAIRRFAKQQMTWFRRWEKQGAHIRWENEPKKIEKLVKKFLAASKKEA